jgi:hypothetical protein
MYDRRRLRLIPALAGVGLALLTAAWVVATRPFAAPDEAAHYLRALEISDGSLVGSKVPFFAPGHPQAPLAWVRQRFTGGHARAHIAWVRPDTRGVLVAPKMSPLLPSGQPQLCVDGRRDTRGRGCVEATYTGDYLPLPYLLPAVALSASSSRDTGLWIARALSALCCIAFLLLAVATLWDGSGWSLVGLLLATTPMVLFVSSVVNPNGLEATAGIAFAAAGLRIVRDRERAPGWVWALLACSGAATMLAWQLGPVFVLIDAAAIALLLGASPGRELLARERKRVRTVALVLIGALGLYLAWALTDGTSHATIRIAPVVHGLRLGVSELSYVFREAVGVFGSLTVPLRSAFCRLWWLLIAAAVVGAVVLGTRRIRLIVLGLTVVGFAFPVVFYAWVYRFSGYDLQGRYVLPLLALIPLVSGEVINQARDRIPRRAAFWLPAVTIGAVAVVQLDAWWTSARAAAGATAYQWFIPHASWHPPLGWWLWVVVAVAGCAALAASGVALLMP